MSEPRERIAESAVEYVTDMVRQWYEDFADMVQSPPELDFLVALVTKLYLAGEPWAVVRQPEEAERLFAARTAMTVIRPQAQIGRYRVDFLVSHKQVDVSDALVVEIDGHAFHEKTKAQVSRDKERERDIVGRGYRVMRFSGSDVWRRPMECADDLFTLIDGLKMPRGPAKP